MQKVIPRLPKELDAPVLIVQHMPVGFTASLAQRLAAMSQVPVEEAAEGTIVQCGHVYVAKGGKHLKVREKDRKVTLELTDEGVREGVKPCANYMFESLIDSSYEDIICVVMTGMGSDGTAGIANLRITKNVKVITQDQTSCTVYGMPKNAVKAGLSDITVSLDEMADTIVKCLSENK